MNKLLTTLLAVTAFAGLSASTAFAQPAAKIVVVNMAKILDEHPETADQNAKLKGDEGKANEELEKLNKEGQDLVTELKEMEESAKNPALATDAKEKLQADMRVKIEEIQRKQNEVQSFRGNTQRSLQQRIQNFRKIMFDKIAVTVTEIAKAKGATMVLDSSGFTHIGISPVIYSDPAYDITAEVQQRVGVAPASASTAPASAPAAGGTSVTFPGAR